MSWEKTNQFDVGLEFSIIDSRIDFSLDYFYKKTTDGLLRKTIPLYDGGGSYWVNAGEISNRGLDASVSADILQNDSGLNWNATLNATFLKNEVVSLAGEKFLYGENVAPGILNEATIIKPGHPLGAFYGYIWEGIDANGHNVYRDLNNDNVIDGNDRDIIGKSIPDVTLGWNNQFFYKNWEANIFCTAAFGGQRLNFTRYGMSTPSGDLRYITLKDAYFENFDQVQNTSASYASILNPGQVTHPNSTQYLEKANYLRIDNISIAYNLPKDFSKFANIRLGLSCQNLYTFSNYKGFDPTSSSFANNSDVTGSVDVGAYPLPRTWTLNARFDF